MEENLAKRLYQKEHQNGEENRAEVKQKNNKQPSGVPAEERKHEVVVFHIMGKKKGVVC